jgi:hypothetical protein
MADSFADSVVSRFEGKSKDGAAHAEPDGDEPKDDGKEGKMLAAAIRRGDSKAIEEAVCAIVDKHKY